MDRVLVLFFMKIKRTCSCGIPVFVENEKYCTYCIQERDWEAFLTPAKKKKSGGKPVGDRMDVEKKIAKLTLALKEAKKELVAVKRREREQVKLEADQQEYILKFQRELPELQRRVQKKIRDL